MPKPKWFRIAVCTNKYSGGPFDPKRPNPIAGNIRSNGRSVVVSPYNMVSHQGTELTFSIVAIAYKVQVNKAPMK